MLNGKAIIILLIVGLIKNINLYKMSYFPEPDLSFCLFLFYPDLILNWVSIIMQQNLI